jgi:hypothetical protein
VQLTVCWGKTAWQAYPVLGPRETRMEGKTMPCPSASRPADELANRRGVYWRTTPVHINSCRSLSCAQHLFQVFLPGSSGALTPRPPCMSVSKVLLSLSPKRAKYCLPPCLHMRGVCFHRKRAILRQSQVLAISGTLGGMF